MWTVIYITQSAKLADRIRTRLADEGFLVRVRQTQVAKQQFEILVPETELDEVQEVLTDVLNGSYD